MVRARAAALAGQDGDVLKAAQRADGHLAEDGDAEPIELGRRPGKLVARSRVKLATAERQGQQNGVCQQDQNAADTQLERVAGLLRCTCGLDAPSLGQHAWFARVVARPGLTNRL